MNVKKILSLITVAACAVNVSAELQINEIMQANISSYYADNEFPDSWVELYNSGTTNFRMAGYRLGETENFDEAVVISGGAIARAGDYFVIYCDKTTAAGYHVDLRLDSGKGNLYLFNPQGEIVDNLSYKKMLGPNVSYGRVSGDSNVWGFMKTATPGEPNKPELITQALPDPVFSREGFVHTGTGGGFILSVSLPEGVTLPSDTRIYYTTDGSEPTKSSKNVASLLRVGIYSTTVVRAKLISDEAVSPNPVTHSYIFHPRSLSLPVISINTDSKYFSDGTIGIFAGENYKYDWRRPINIEYFDSRDAAANINQMGECRVHGAYTRVNPQKSLAVYTQKRFGNKRFDYPFWAEKPQIEQVKSFVLRNGGNCFGGNRIADQAGQTLFGRNTTNLDYMENTEVVAYINGQYVGIYDLRERSNEDNISSNYDGLEDIHMVENYTEIKEGNMQAFNDFVALFNSNPTQEQMEAVVDFDNFAKSVIAETYVTNTDWPGNNMVMWRPAADGGKWRILIKDLDFYAANGYNSTYFNHLLRANGHEDDTGEGNMPERVKVFQVLWGYPEFRDMIIDNFTVNAGDFLRKNLVREHIEKICDEIDSEYSAYMKVYGYKNGYDHWKSSVGGLISWSENRSDFIRDNLVKSYFGLGSKVPVTIVTNDANVTMQGVALTQPEFIGNYYAGRTLRVATDNIDDGWHAKVTYGNGTVRTLDISRNTYELNLTESIKNVELEVVHGAAVTDVYVPSQRDITMTCAAGNVCVESSSVLGTITVVDVAGRVVETHPGGSHQVQLQLPEHGLYVVTATNATGAELTNKFAF